MSIDICIVPAQKENFHNLLHKVELTGEIERYINSGIIEHCKGIEILLALDSYRDTLFLTADLKSIKALCDNILNSYGDPNDYSIYAKLKKYQVNREVFTVFASSLLELINYALDNGDAVYAIGD